MAFDQPSGAIRRRRAVLRETRGAVRHMIFHAARACALVRHGYQRAGESARSVSRSPHPAAQCIHAGCRPDAGLFRPDGRRDPRRHRGRGDGATRVAGHGAYLAGDRRHRADYDSRFPAHAPHWPARRLHRRCLHRAGRRSGGGPGGHPHRLPDVLWGDAAHGQQHGLHAAVSIRGSGKRAARTPQPGRFICARGQPRRGHRESAARIGRALAGTRNAIRRIVRRRQPVVRRDDRCALAPARPRSIRAAPEGRERRATHALRHAAVPHGRVRGCVRLRRHELRHDRGADQHAQRRSVTASRRRRGSCRVTFSRCTCRRCSPGTSSRGSASAT